MAAAVPAITIAYDRTVTRDPSDRYPANQDSAPPLNCAVTARPAITPITTKAARTIPNHMPARPPATKEPSSTRSTQFITALLLHKILTTSNRHNASASITAVLSTLEGNSGRSAVGQTGKIEKGRVSFALSTSRPGPFHGVWEIHVTGQGLHGTIGLCQQYFFAESALGLHTTIRSLNGIIPPPLSVPSESTLGIRHMARESRSDSRQISIWLLRNHRIPAPCQGRMRPANHNSRP